MIWEFVLIAKIIYLHCVKRQTWNANWRIYYANWSKIFFNGVKTELIIKNDISLKCIGNFVWKQNVNVISQLFINVNLLCHFNGVYHLIIYWLTLRNWLHDPALVIWEPDHFEILVTIEQHLEWIPHDSLF